MNWFERITGFQEGDYFATQKLLDYQGSILRSRTSGRAFGMGQFKMPSLAELRARVREVQLPAGRLRLRIVQGDARHLHQSAEFAGALFQVASQFNMLEMVSPEVTPEDGVARYENDLTQGPACAMAAGAATIYRNYLVPVDGENGQTAGRQLDGLADLARYFEGVTGIKQPELWSMKNGYALASNSGLKAIARQLESLGEAQYNAVMGKLRIGVHSDVEVTDSITSPGPRVSQAFCSALPVAYGVSGKAKWAPFAKFVLKASYEATLAAACLNAARGASNTVLLTMLGGGAFGNETPWIHDAIRHAVSCFNAVDLDVRIVSYGPPTQALMELVEDYSV